MAPARTFAELIVLVDDAEDALIRKAKQIDPVDRACTLRGIFYGTEWSLDYKGESRRSHVGALVRNLGFLTYTGGHLPADPRPALGLALFNDLQNSQSIHDRGYGIDVGHVLIGLDLRHSSVRALTFAGQGGTGLEIVTWLGDLGGGAASLARKRATKPTTSVRVVFENAASDYGAMDNLEGDLGGYLVACGSSPGGTPIYPTGRVTDAIAAYLPLTTTAHWTSRAARFATYLGATVSPAGITNSKKVSATLSDQLYEFSVWYAATRWIPSGELLGPAAQAACAHMRGAADEVATVFVAALSRAISRPGSPVSARSPYPSPTPPGKCMSKLMKAASVDVASVRVQLEEWGRDLIQERK